MRKETAAGDPLVEGEDELGESCHVGVLVVGEPLGEIDLLGEVRVGVHGYAARSKPAARSSE